MYCDKDNVNTLTALLIAHGVRHAVVCPGSRNAPIVHNLDVCPEIQCYPITDERSAAFYALGLCQATEEPVVVCVTSGTALLNTLPAVAEAMYQHLPLVVVSADRPKQWIGQLTGQTMPQPGGADLLCQTHGGSARTAQRRGALVLQPTRQRGSHRRHTTLPRPGAHQRTHHRTPLLFQYTRVALGTHDCV